MILTCYQHTYLYWHDMYIYHVHHQHVAHASVLSFTVLNFIPCMYIYNALVACKHIIIYLNYLSCYIVQIPADIHFETVSVYC